MKRVNASPEAWMRHLDREAARYRAKRHDHEWSEARSLRRKRYHASRLRFVDAVRTTCGCIDCGTREGRLDFDHRPGTVKKFNVANVTRSITSLLSEIEKCDVRCAACHARRHLNSEPPRRTRRTHCIRGHLFDEENTYYNAREKQRHCRACDRLRKRRLSQGGDGAV